VSNCSRIIFHISVQGQLVWYYLVPFSLFRSIFWSVIFLNSFACSTLTELLGGLVGPLIIHGPSNAKYDIDLGPVFLSDWYHTEYFKIVQEIMQPLQLGGNPRPSSDNNLINGKMNFDCSTVAAGDATPCINGAGLSKFKFSTGKTHRLRLINAGSEGIQRFSIDGHNMTVIANDFVPIVSIYPSTPLPKADIPQKPYTTEVVTLGIGQRADVLVTATAGNAQSAWWMRSNISIPCTQASQPNALAAIYYDKADATKAPTSVAWNVPDPGTCANDDLSLTVPYYSITAMTPSTTRTMVIDNIVNKTGSFLWRLDGTSARVNYNHPILLLAEQGNITYPEDWNVKNFGTNTTVRVVVNNPSPASHPMHLHGHNMQILSEGAGNWDGSTIVNANNPLRRDVQLVRANGYFVMQYDLDNPGVWPFHCHIAWHVSGGLYANFLERPADIGKDTSIPMVMQQTCTNWMKYTNADVVDQIDSGV
jgi:FtsP/CotA-like multicopper oxidase with cupredoxin domain